MCLSTVAAGFTPERADEPVAMATFKRVGTFTPSKNSSTARHAMATARISRRCFAQIRDFGTYGFPEAHAASFALLVHVSYYLKCHCPAGFVCALLNSQP
jgi:error-prone DNA polymerase